MKSCHCAGANVLRIGFLVVAVGGYGAVMLGPQLAGAASVKPVDFRNMLPASDPAAEAALVKRQLGILRSQIARFTAEHKGEAPRLLDGGWDVLIEARSRDAQSPRYLTAAPVNPRVMSNALGPWEDAEKAGQSAKTPRPGWYYNQATGEILAAEFDESSGTWRKPEAAKSADKGRH